MALHAIIDSTHLLSFLPLPCGWLPGLVPCLLESNQRPSLLLPLCLPDPEGEISLCSAPEKARRGFNFQHFSAALGASATTVHFYHSLLAPSLSTGHLYPLLNNCWLGHQHPPAHAQTLHLDLASYQYHHNGWARA